MPQDAPKSPEQTLLEYLSFAASYSDKGWMWRNDTREVRANTLAKYQAALMLSVEKIGKSNLPEILVQAIESGMAVNDSSGKYCDIAQAHFAESKKNPLNERSPISWLAGLFSALTRR